MPLTDTAEEEKSIPRACEARIGDGIRDKTTGKLHTCSRKTSSVPAVRSGMGERGVSGKSWKQWLMSCVGRRQAAAQRALPRFGQECLHRRTGPGFVAPPPTPR